MIVERAVDLLQVYFSLSISSTTSRRAVAISRVRISVSSTERKRSLRSSAKRSFPGALHRLGLCSPRFAAISDTTSVCLRSRIRAGITTSVSELPMPPEATGPGSAVCLSTNGRNTALWSPAFKKWRNAKWGQGSILDKRELTRQRGRYGEEHSHRI